MAAYAQFGYGGYPSANQQLLSSTAGPSQHTVDPTAAQSAISVVNAPDHSPVGEGRINVVTGTDASTGALSPDKLSQTSNAPGAVVSAGSVSNNASMAADNSSQGHAASTGTTCCENGRPIMTDPVSGQTVCSCQYDSARLALSSYSRMPATGVSVYGTPYPSTDQNPYQSIGVDSSAFYSPLSNPYALKDSTTGSEMTAWTSAGLQPTTGYYSYDPMGAYGYGASYDLAARRKNATRESTATLKAWLNEHKKNPYPTKGEKIMLAIITKMTLTQVSTWFANARRRLKKENKMTWEPKNRTDDDDDALVSDDEKDKEDLETEKSSSNVAMLATGGGGLGVIGEHRKDSMNQHLKSDHEKHEDDHPEDDLRAGPHTPEIRVGYPGAGYSGNVMSVGGSHPHNYHPYHHHQHAAYYQHQQAVLAASYHPSNNKEDNSDSKNQLSRDCGVPIPATKPKIWSLADTVACKTPPPSAAFMGQQQQCQQMMPQQHMSANHNMAITEPLRQQQHQQHITTNIAAVPFSRTPSAAYGGFPGATVQQLHTMSNSPYRTSNISSSNNNNSNGSISTNNIISGNSNNSSITPTFAQLHQQQLLHHQQQQQHQHHQHLQQLHHPHTASQRMGFPEAQPDTPPQTPPNMKLLSVASNLLHTATQTHTTDNYRHSNAPYATATNMPTRYGSYSPRDDSSSRSSSSGSEANDSNASYLPFFKSQQRTNFVPPV